MNRLRREQRKHEKEKRKKEQEANVRKKDALKKKNKEKALDGMRTHEPELTGKEKRAVKAWQGENAEKVQFFFTLLHISCFFCFLF